MPRPDLIGEYGDNHDARAAVARVGYLALTMDQAIYPVYVQEFSLGATGLARCSSQQAPSNRAWLLEYHDVSSRRNARTEPDQLVLPQ